MNCGVLIEFPAVVYVAGAMMDEAVHSLEGSRGERVRASVHTRGLLPTPRRTRGGADHAH
jgi:hypothetical protein